MSEPAINTLKAIDTLNHDLTKVDDCVVEAIREVKPDGTSPLIGTIGIWRCRWMELAFPGPPKLGAEGCTQ